MIWTVINFLFIQHKFSHIEQCIWKKINNRGNSQYSILRMKNMYSFLSQRIVNLNCAGNFNKRSQHHRYIYVEHLFWYLKRFEPFFQLWLLFRLEIAFLNISVCKWNHNWIFQLFGKKRNGVRYWKRQNILTSNIQLKI